MTRWPVAALLVASPLIVAACTATTQPAGRWIGDVTPETPGPLCAPSRGTAQIDQGRLTFAPTDGTWILRGSAETDGTITAERIQTGADKQPYETRLVGRWTPTIIEGSYTTPRCTFKVSLARR